MMMLESLMWWRYNQDVDLCREDGIKKVEGFWKLEEQIMQ